MDPRLKLCPRCGSHEVHSDQLTPLGQRHKCPACGYEGAFVIEADSIEDAKKIHRELQADLEESQAGGTEPGEEENDA